MDNNDIEAMKNTDIRTVDKSSLVDIKDIHINPKSPPNEKTAEYVRQIKNPYCFLCNGYAVKIEFSDNERTIEDCFMDYIDSLI